MGTQGGPLLLVDPETGLSGQDLALLDTNRAELYSGWVFGGPAAVPTGIDKQLGKAIAGPLGAVDGGGNRLAAASAAGLSPQDAAGLRSALPHRGAGNLGGAAKLTPSRP
jgi:hypothetical protein